MVRSTGFSIRGKRRGLSVAVLAVAVIVPLAAFAYYNPEEPGPPPQGVEEVSADLPQSKNTVEYIEKLESNGSSALVQEVSIAAPKLVQSYMSQFRYSPEAADSPGAVQTEMAQEVSTVVTPSSPADGEVARLTAYTEETSGQVQGYSDNSFRLERIVGVDASDPKSIFVVLEGSHVFDVNPVPEAADVSAKVRDTLNKDHTGWITSSPTQIQLQLIPDETGAFRIFEYLERGLPGEPAP